MMKRLSTLVLASTSVVATATYGEVIQSSNRPSEDALPLSMMLELGRDIDRREGQVTNEDAARLKASGKFYGDKLELKVRSDVVRKEGEGFFRQGMLRGEYDLSLAEGKVGGEDTTLRFGSEGRLTRSDPSSSRVKGRVGVAASVKTALHGEIGTLKLALKARSSLTGGNQPGEVSLRESGGADLDGLELTQEDGTADTKQVTGQTFGTEITTALSASYLPAFAEGLTVTAAVMREELGSPVMRVEPETGATRADLNGSGLQRYDYTSQAFGRLQIAYKATETVAIEAQSDFYNRASFAAPRTIVSTVGVSVKLI